MLPEPTVLVVDAEADVRHSLAEQLRLQGHVVREALLCHSQNGGGPDGLVRFTGSGPIAALVSGGRGWRCDFLKLPPNEHELLQPRLVRPPRGAMTSAEHDVVAVSEAMTGLVAMATRVANADSTVLISGESGSGKEVVARLLVERSRRSRRTFVAVNCAAIPDALIESELFGYRKGAFTGAADDRKGLIEAADGGVLFLDEVGEMPLSTQSRLLRFLDSHEVRRVGDSTSRIVDVRIIAATNRVLETEVREGRFRLDLFYRLNVIRIQVPPLRERVPDIVPLAHYCLQRSASRVEHPIREIDADAVALLERHDWPGNVRELQNVIERAAVSACGGTITALDVLTALGSDPFRRQRRELPWKDPAAMAAPVGNLSDVAAALGISRTTLWRRLKAQRSKTLDATIDSHPDPTTA